MLKRFWSKQNKIELIEVYEMKRYEFILYLVVVTIAVSVVTHYVDTYNEKQIRNCNINITTESVTMHHSGYVDVISAPDCTNASSDNRKD